MLNAFAWSKLSLQQKYDYGIWIVISTLSVVISSFFAIIVSLNNNQQKLQNEFEKRVQIEVTAARKKDSITIIKLQIRLESSELKYLTFLEQKEKKYTELLEKAKLFKMINDEK